jgi:hypothetical protein
MVSGRSSAGIGKLPSAEAVDPADQQADLRKHGRDVGLVAGDMALRRVRLGEAHVGPRDEGKQCLADGQRVGLMRALSRRFSHSLEVCQNTFRDSRPAATAAMSVSYPGRWTCLPRRPHLRSRGPCSAGPTWEVLPFTSVPRSPVLSQEVVAANGPLGGFLAFVQGLEPTRCRHQTGASTDSVERSRERASFHRERPEDGRRAAASAISGAGQRRTGEARACRW